jgi:hypothetical protein
MFPHRNIHKYTWTSPDRNNHNQVDNILIDRLHSSILHVRTLTRADCDALHCQVVAKVRERLAVSKRAAQNFHVEKFNLRELN